MFLPEEKSFSDGRIVCGVDEAGRGPLAGPISMAMVHFPAPVLEQVLEGSILKGLTDSKKVPEKKRNLLYLELVSLPIVYSHCFISNRFIDRFGLSRTIYYGIVKLIKKSNLQNPFLLIDGNYSFENRFLGEAESFSYKSIIKGDSKIASIAAASIIAKYVRDEYMIHISSKFPEFNFQKHKGYGTRDHILSIQKYGPSSIHRKSFLKGI